jgi:hypothetical protein
VDAGAGALVLDPDELDELDEPADLVVDELGSERGVA